MPLMTQLFKSFAMVSLAACGLTALAADAPQPSAGPACVRYDGVYRAVQPAPGGKPSWRYLRFYKDKTVIVTNSPQEAEELVKTFGKEDHTLFQGKLKQKGNTVSFPVRNSYGTVEHTGEVVGAGLHVTWNSLINNQSASHDYVFVALPTNGKPAAMDNEPGRCVPR